MFCIDIIVSIKLKEKKMQIQLMVKHLQKSYQKQMEKLQLPVVLEMKDEEFVIVKEIQHLMMKEMMKMIMVVVKNEMNLKKHLLKKKKKQEQNRQKLRN